MARITDKNKLNSIKIKLIDLIVQNGISNTSISMVAKEANVSAGYLYRHYDSKEDLLLDVYKEKFKEINNILKETIDSRDNLEEFIYNFYMNLLKLAQRNENDILFLLKMMTDYSIKISTEMREELIETINLFKDKFKNEFNLDIKNEQLFIQIFVSFLILVNLRKRKVLNDGAITKDDVRQITKMTVNSLN